MDIGVRRGQFWQDIPDPKIIGVEGAGIIRAIGPGVRCVDVGQRVAWAYAPGSYAEKICVPAKALVAVPDEISDRTAAAVMMQGLTASHFATDFYPVSKNEFALVHAAAGGVGTLLTQIIKILGGRVIGRVSHGSKVAAAYEAGADYVIVDAKGRFAGQVLELTGDEGVDVVFDGSGDVTFADSLSSLRSGGTFCWYGTALAGAGSVDLVSLPRSIKIGYAVFSDHVRTPQLLRLRAKRLFDWILEGKLKVHIGHEYPLRDAAQALMDLESRMTIGKSILIP
jgi:NADPH2:quinone reductase